MKSKVILGKSSGSPPLGPVAKAVISATITKPAKFLAQRFVVESPPAIRLNGVETPLRDLHDRRFDVLLSVRNHQLGALGHRWINR
jgi:hypothetical protein